MIHNVLCSVRLHLFFRTIPVVLVSLSLCFPFPLLSQQPPVKNETGENTDAPWMEECLSRGDLLVRLCIENHILKERLEQAAIEVQARDVRIETEKNERDAQILRQELEFRKTVIIEEEMERERRTRIRYERDMDILQGNLMFPGLGQIRAGQDRGWFWAGGFLLSFGAVLLSYREQKRIESHYLSGSEALFPSSAAQDYQRAYKRTEALALLPVLFYAGSILDFYLFPDNISDPSLARDSSGKSLSVRLGWTFAFD